MAALSRVSSREPSPTSTNRKRQYVITDQGAATRRAGRRDSYTGGTTKSRTYVWPGGQLQRPYGTSETYENWQALRRLEQLLTTSIEYTARKTCIMDPWCRMTRQIWMRRWQGGWISPWTKRESSV